jgi:hypothetical protein
MIVDRWGFFEWEGELKVKFWMLVTIIRENKISG